jgi:hypothetical protein
VTGYTTLTQTAREGRIYVHPTIIIAINLLVRKKQNEQQKQKTKKTKKPVTWLEKTQIQTALLV